MDTTDKGARYIRNGIIAAAVLIIVSVGGCMGLSPLYSVWSSKMEGEAELAKANYSKQTKVQEAIAENDAAKYKAEAAVTAASGVAAANTIIGQSLKDNPDYLHYLWINKLGDAENHNEVIYVPTEANMPIMEAGRVAQAQQK
jgi:regulator of protease activity HflC (stomatin/prohibitin superfamily)